MKLRNKIFLIVAISLVVIAIISIIIGYAMIGADILGWFTSRYAQMIYLFGGLYLLVWLGLEVWDKIKNE